MVRRGSTHDDCVDALAGAYNSLSRSGGSLTSHVPRGRIPLNRGRDRHDMLSHGHDPVATLAARLGARVYSRSG
jgi:hypothetical protein